MFYHAQKAVLHPVGPLYSLDDQEVNKTEFTTIEMQQPPCSPADVFMRGSFNPDIQNLRYWQWRIVEWPWAERIPNALL